MGTQGFHFYSYPNPHQHPRPEFLQNSRLIYLSLSYYRLTDLSKVHQHVSVLMDSVNASANILNNVFYGQYNGNEAGAASCTLIEVRGGGADEGKESNQIRKGMKGKEGELKAMWKNWENDMSGNWWIEWRGKHVGIP